MAGRIYHGRMSEPPFEGRAIVVRGETFVVPELTIGARRALSPKLKWMYERFGAGSGKNGEVPYEELERLHSLWFETALLALKMNYPEITPELVAENFSLSQIRQCFEAAVGVPARDSSEPARPTLAATETAAAGSNPTGAKSTDF